VHRAEHKIAGTPCAIKVITKEKLRETKVYLDLMKNELECLEALEHPHIVRVYELLEDNQNIYVVLELIEGGNLLETITKIQSQKLSFTERDAANIIYQVMLALNYMHTRRTMHRDLNLENLLVEFEKDEAGQT